MAYPCHSTMGQAQPQRTSRLVATLLTRISTTFLTKAEAGGSEAKCPPRTSFLKIIHISHTGSRRASSLTMAGKHKHPYQQHSPLPETPSLGPHNLQSLVTHPSQPRLLLQQQHSFHKGSPSTAAQGSPANVTGDVFFSLIWQFTCRPIFLLELLCRATS